MIALYPLDTGCKLTMRKTFRRLPGGLLKRVMHVRLRHMSSDSYYHISIAVIAIIILISSSI